MGRRRRFDRPIGLLVLSIGCQGEAPITHVSWPEMALPFALIVEQQDEDARLVAGPMRVPTEPVLWSATEGRSLLLVGLTEAQLHALHPRVDGGRSPDGFAVHPLAETCERGRSMLDGRRSFPLPAARLEVHLLHGEADDDDVARLRTTLSTWSIEAPLDATVCGAENWRTASFADQVQLLDAGTIIDGEARYPTDPEDTNLYFELRTGDWISDDAVALSTEHMLFWVERGASFSDTLDRRLRYANVLPAPSEGTGWGAYAVHRVPGEDGTLLVGLASRNPERAALLMIDTRRGRFEAVSSSTSAGHSITSLAIDEEHHLLVGGRMGRVGVGTVESGVSTWATLPGEVANVDHCVSLRAPEPSFLVATAGGSVYIVPWGRPDAARRVLLPGDPSGVSSLSRLEGEDGVYMILRPNERPVFSPDGSSWEQVGFDVPLPARGCAQVADTCGEHGFAEIIGMSGPLEDEAFLLSPRTCTGLFRFAPRWRCLDALPLPEDPAITREPGLRWYGTKRRGGRVIAFGEPARLIEISAR